MSASVNYQQRIKLRLTRRDGRARCHYCKRRDKLANLTVDHRIPKSLGGSNRLENLVLACAPCNHAKGSALWFGPLVFQ